MLRDETSAPRKIQMTYLEIGCRAALAFVLLVASTSKIHSARSYREFHDSLKDLGLSSDLLLRLLSLGIPAAEAATVVLLVIDRLSMWGLGASLVLIGAFTTAIAVARAQGKVVRCRCFGESGSPSGSLHILRNVVLMAWSAAGAVADLVPASHQGPGMVVFAVGLGIIAAALVLRWDELSFLLKPGSAS